MTAFLQLPRIWEPTIHFGTIGEALTEEQTRTDRTAWDNRIAINSPITGYSQVFRARVSFWEIIPGSSAKRFSRWHDRRFPTIHCPASSRSQKATPKRRQFDTPSATLLYSPS
jgi:hypothetical protein